MCNKKVYTHSKDPRTKNPRVFCFKEPNMNELKETKPMPSQFILTPEQKLALVEAKVKRAEAHIKALAEIVRKLNKR